MNGQNWLSKLSFWVVKKGSKIGVKTQVGRMSFCTVNRQMVPTSGSNFGLQLLAPTLGSNFGRCFWSIFWPILNPILESHFVCNSGIVLDCTHPVDAKHCKGQHAVRPIDESMLSKGLPQSSRVCNDVWMMSQALNCNGSPVEYSDALLNAANYEAPQTTTRYTVARLVGCWRSALHTWKNQGLVSCFRGLKKTKNPILEKRGTRSTPLEDLPRSAVRAVASVSR